MAIGTYTSPLLATIGQWAGPILDKELRVASRRRRHYVLRSVYIGLLCVFVGFTWVASMGFGALRSGGSATYTASRMAEVGRAVTPTILWFQFICMQLMACALLSGAIGDEIRTRTLGVLLTTQVNRFQIIFGKLISRLLQMLLLLCISLPLLSIIRVFGGVQWNSVLAGLAVTATSTLFIGSLSLLVSCYMPQAHRALFMALILCVLLFLGLPMVLWVFHQFDLLSGAFCETTILLTNPFVAMNVAIQDLLGRGATWWIPWPWHCLTMLAGAGACIGVSMAVVRRAALRTSDTPTRKLGRSIIQWMDRMAGGSSGPRVDGAPIKGSPIVWREMGSAFMRRTLGKVIVYSVMGVILVAIIITTSMEQHVGMGILSVVSSVLSLLLVIRIAAQSATCITREKEARTWAILLTSPMEDSHIIRDKAFAIIGRNLPVLIFVSALMLLSVFVMGAEEPLSAVMLIGYLLSIAGSIVFVMGLGLFFSVILRSSVASVAATIAIFVAVSQFCCGCSTCLTPFLVFLAPLVPVTVWTVAGLLMIRFAIGKVRQNIF